MTSLAKMIASSNGAKIRGGSSSPERFYIPWGQDQGMTRDKAKALFEAIKAIAKRS